MTSKPKRAKRRRGRPSRAQATAKALAKVDLGQIDPRQVLLQVAADTSAPATARVAACKVLMGVTDGKPDKPAAEDPVTALAIQLLKGRK